MKKLIRFFVVLLVILVVIVLGFVAFISMRGIPSYPTAQVDYHLAATPEKVENGEKIASMLCNSCHKSMDGTALTGRLMLDAPKEFGDIHSANITNDKTFGIGKYTDGELAFLLRTGIKRTGKFAVVMPKFNSISDYDLESIIAYLRSGKPMVQGKPVATVPSSFSFLTKFLCLVAFKPATMPSAPIPMPDTTNLIAYGRYLSVNLYSCYACHSADFKTLNEQMPEKSPGYFGGGNTLLSMTGEKLKSSNITFHATGIGSWDLNKFDKALRSGLVEQEPALRYPMEPYAKLTDLEVKAIYTYLKSLPPVENKVSR